MNPRPRRSTAALLAALLLPACTPQVEGTGSSPAHGDTQQTAATPADSLPAELHPLWPEDLPPGDGPLFPFADSTSGSEWWGFRDARGRTVLRAQFHYTTPMFEGRAAVAETGEYGAPRWGYVNAGGELVVPLRFDGAGSFSNGRAPVMRDDAYMLVDTTGAVVERLAAVPAANVTLPVLPVPCDSCTLGEYARRLPRVGEPMQVYVQPRIGESLHRTAILRHPGDWLSVAEGGWEHWAYELRLPGVSRADAEALARRIMGEGQYTELRDADDDGALVLRAAGARNETGNEEMRVRVWRGVVLIAHSDGV